MKRKRPLQRRTELKRGKPLKRTAWKRKAPKNYIPSRVRRLVRERSAGVCELQVPNVCTYWATDIDHIKNRPHCDRDEKHDPSNLKHACRPCHDWKGANPDEAHERGIYRRAWE